MRFTVDQAEYQISFQTGDDVLVRNKSMNGKRTSREESMVVPAVSCFIRPAPKQRGQKTRPIAKGTALCSPLDNFDLVVGRKVALTKALQMAGFTKSQRSQIWTQYHATHRSSANTSPSALKRRIRELEAQIARGPILVLAELRQEGS